MPRAPFFCDTSRHVFKPGQFFLGLDHLNREIGIETERHAITIAGAGSGKGAALIIPNLLRWPHNALVVDPKGENATATWKAREALGQKVYVLDPFEVADIPDRLRASCNLLAAIRPDSLTAREDIRVIADGLVMRYKAEDGTWDNGAVSVLAGMLAYVASDPVADGRSLPAVRRLLTLPPDDLREVFEDMANSDVFGGLCRAAAAIGLSDSRKNREFVGGAIDHSEWLDSPAMAAILTGDGFDLSEVKTGDVTVYLVLPPQYLTDHGRFLRVFVRAALDAMAKSLKGKRCLFLLDEFHSLGRIDQIATAAGLMRGYGVQLWPFLQDLGQLQGLYKIEGLHGFFSNADAHIFFGNTDALTLDYISRQLGPLTMAEIGPAPTHVHGPPASGQDVAAFLGGGSRNRHAAQGAQMAGSLLAGVANAIGQLADLDAQQRMNAWQVEAAGVGKPRFAPEQVRELVAKRDHDKVARSMIVFGKGRDVYYLNLSPYFRPVPETRQLSGSAGRHAHTPEQKKQMRHVGLGVLGFIVLAFIANGFIPDGNRDMAPIGFLLLVPWIVWFLAHRRWSKADAPPIESAPAVRKSWKPLLQNVLLAVVGINLLGALGPLIQPGTVRPEVWPALFAMWGVLAALFAALVVWKRRK